MPSLWRLRGRQSTALVSYSCSTYQTPRWSELPGLSSRPPRLYCCALFCACLRLCRADAAEEHGCAAGRCFRSSEGDNGSWIVEVGHGTPLPVAWEHLIVPEGPTHSHRAGGEAVYSQAQNETDCSGSGAMAACIRGRNTHSASVPQIWKDGALKLIFFSSLRCI